MQRNRYRNFVKLVRLFMVLVVAVIIGFGLSRLVEPLHISTNLKDLSPNLSTDTNVNQAISRLSSAIENRLSLVVVGDASGDPSKAAEELSSALTKIPSLTIIDPSSNSTSKIVELLLPFRFGLLTTEQQQKLQNHTEKQLVQQSLARLYGLTGTGSPLPMTDDPIGWFGDYLANTSQLLNSAAEASNVIKINMILPGNALESDAQNQIGSAIYQAITNTQQQFPNVRILRSGVFFFAAEASAKAQREIRVIGTISLIGVVALLLLAFYSLRPLILPLLSIATGVAFACALNHLVFGSLHVLTIVFGASLIGIVVDYSLHFFYHLADTPKPQTNLHKLIPAMTLSLASSVIGYAALGFSDLLSLRKVALFSCGGLIAAWITVIALGPWLMGDGIKTNPRFLPPLVAQFFNLTAKAGRISHWICILLISILIVLLWAGIKTNDNPGAFFNPSSQLLAEQQEIARLSSNIEPGRYFIIRANNLQQLYQKLSDLEQNSKPGSLISINKLIPSPDQQADNYLLAKKLYSASGAIEQFMLSIQMTPESITRLQQQYVDAADKSLSPLELFSTNQGALPPLVMELNDAIYGFVLVSDTEGIAPAQLIAQATDGIDYIDTATMASQSLAGQRKGSMGLLLVAFGLIGILLLVRYQKIGSVQMLWVPGGAVILTLALFSAMGMGITVFHAMALFLVLGLGMDYVIFVAELGSSKSTTLQAVFLSAITSLLAFGLLGFSSIPVVKAFGLTLLFGNTFNLIGSMIYAHVSLKKSTV